MLGTGLLIYMLSKEIYVINHETFAAASIGAVIIYGVKKFGPQVAAFADKLNEVGRKHRKSHRCVAKIFLLSTKTACHLKLINTFGLIQSNNPKAV